MKINFPLLALAIGAFAIGSTEFSPMGFLPQIAESLRISIPTAGMLISAYALGVMIAAPIMTLLLGRYPQRKALIILMAIFTLGNLLAVFASNYWGLMAARIITSLNHGAFFGIGSVVATHVVAADKKASAVASMFMGLTLANIIGVPIATWIAQHIGWRMTFAVISGLGLATMLALYRALPSGVASSKTNIRLELKVLTRTPVLLALATTVLSSGAMFSLYTYIAPSLQQFSHASTSMITWMLVLIGMGFSIGNHLGGKLADIDLNKTLIGFLSMLMLIMLLFPVLAQTTLGAALALVLWGIAAFAVVPPLQMRVMAVAHEAPGLASSVNIGAFNLGNALGAFAGASVLHLGWHYGAVSWAGAGLSAAALLLVLLYTPLRRGGVQVGI